MFSKTLATILMLLAGGFSLFDFNQEPQLLINDAIIQVELADTPTARRQGLSGRSTLPTNRGLLFIFDEPDLYSFWMKEMNFAIDIVWIDENWRVAAITAETLPESYPQAFAPPRPIKYVLEINAGRAAALGISPGDSVILKE